MIYSLAQLAGSELEFANQSDIHPIGLALVFCLGLATVMVPRRYALLPLLIMACFVAPAQRLVVMSLDFSLIRIMVLFIFARILMNREYRGFRWVTMDTLFVTLWTVNSIVYVAQWGNSGAIVNRLGVGFEAMGLYFLARLVIRDWDDLVGFICAAAVISIAVSGFFLIENRTGRNLFSVFGGVSEITGVRQGRLRCQGPFSHPIIAGVFWASLMPLFAALFWQGARERVAGLAGVAGSLIIVVCCASSTPVLAVIAGVVGACFYPLRGRIRYVLWTAIGLLVVLHLVMQAPVWHLIARISAVGGSTGWHRYHLIDRTIGNVSEWAILGVKSTGHWGYGLNDVTNQYILYAVTGGIVSLLLFVALLVAAFRGVGIAVKAVSKEQGKVVLVWAVGVMLFVHCMCFIGVSYFGQANMIWYLSLAIAANVATVLAPQFALIRRTGQVRSAFNASKRHGHAIRAQPS